MAPSKRRASTPVAGSAGKVRKTDAEPAAQAAASSKNKEQAAHLLLVHDALTTIRNCSIFDGIQEALPLAIKEGGNQTPFDQQSLKDVLGQNEKAEYRCGFNFMWPDATWLANHRVPVNAGQVKHLQKHHFPFADPPTSNPFVQWVAVDNADFKVMEHIGGLQRVSPEEVDHAMLFSIAQAINDNCADDVLRRWRD